MGRHAAFNILKITSEYIFIKDIGYKTRLSVTNDAGWVVGELGRKYGVYGRRIFYQDSLGDIDELLHGGNRFTGFSFGHEGIGLVELLYEETLKERTDG
jgi:hypothetical protein